MIIFICFVRKATNGTIRKTALVLILLNQVRFVRNTTTISRHHNTHNSSDTYTRILDYYIDQKQVPHKDYRIKNGNVLFVQPKIKHPNYE